MVKKASLVEQRRIAEAVREACVRAAQEGYEHAAISGLCEEGAFEAAIGAIRMVDVEAAIATSRDHGEK